MWPWSSPSTNHSLAFPFCSTAGSWWYRREDNTELPFFPVLSVKRGKSGDLYCATQGLWLLGCSMQVWRGTLYDSASCKIHSRAAALCWKTKRGKALEIPAHLHAAGICLQHLQVSVCILHLWVLSRHAIKTRMFLQRNKHTTGTFCWPFLFPILALGSLFQYSHWLLTF